MHYIIAFYISVCVLDDGKDAMFSQDDDDTAPYWQIAFATVGACAAMYMFARMHGLIRL